MRAVRRLAERFPDLRVEEFVFFDGWDQLVRVIVVGVFAYVALVAALRIAGNRTLSKMNAFDLVVTVALGSVLATALLSETVSLAESIVAFLLLIGLQFVVTWLAVRFGPFRRLITAEPELLAYRGALLEGRMRRQRVLESEIQAAIRGEGFAALDDVEAVVLESDGTFSVVQGSARSPWALQPLSLPRDEQR